MPEPVIRFLRRGGVIHLAVALVTLSIMAWMGAVSLRSSAPSAPAVSTFPEPPTPHELAVTLTRLRLDAESLAAAGLSAPQVTALVGRVSSHLQTAMQTIREADNEWAARRQEVDRLERLIRAGIGREQNVAALGPARTALTNAASSRQSALDAVLSEALEGVAAGPTGSLQTVRTNAGSWDLPTQYLAGSHDEANWVNLREALANDRVSAQLGREPDPAAHQFLLTAQSDPAVAAAATNLTANLAEVRAAWNAAVYP